MPLWKPEDVKDQPKVDLKDWQVQEVLGSHSEEKTRHFIGRLSDGSGRVSSAIQSYDPETRVGITQSGRAYRLVGDQGVSVQAAYVWAHWVGINAVTESKDVSGEYEAVPLN